MNNKLLLVSTPRHLYLLMGMAFNDSHNKYHLVFIDQKLNKEENPLYLAISKNLGPFESVEYLPIKYGGSKLSFRRGLAVILQKYINKHMPDEIFCGNDRRYEYQFSLRYARGLKYGEVFGSYIDDGTGSYISSKEISLFKYFSDRFIDTPLKKLAYGCWYERSSPLGKSKWVDRRYLCHSSLLQGSDIFQLQPRSYLKSSMLEYLSMLLSEFGENIHKLHDSNSLVVILPHSSIINNMYGDSKLLVKLIDSFAVKSEKVFIKYHPREAEDPLKLGIKYELLNSKLPMEMYLTLIPFEKVIGDVSSALMASKWLRPESKVLFFKNDSLYSKAIEKLFGKIGIKELDVNHD